jgi:SAM-dependent methyltransferase
MKYSKSFYANQQKGIHNSEIIVPLILEFIKPKSVIDVGCGVGHFLQSFKERGINNVLGVDGKIPEDKMLIHNCFFKKVDLNVGIDVDRKFDLALCLEVGEHLEPNRAKFLVKELTTLSDVIVFSSAIPGQGGTHHINEQFQSYWVDLFKEEDYVKIDCLRPRLWNNLNIDLCYRQNMFFFVRDISLNNYKKLKCEGYCSLLMPVNIVHPNMYRHEDLRGIPLKRAIGTILFLPHIIVNSLRRKP